jgi:hypothetical protein
MPWRSFRFLFRSALTLDPTSRLFACPSPRPLTTTEWRRLCWEDSHTRSDRATLRPDLLRSRRLLCHGAVQPHRVELRFARQRSALGERLADDGLFADGQVAVECTDAEENGSPRRDLGSRRDRRVGLRTGGFAHAHALRKTYGRCLRHRFDTTKYTQPNVQDPDGRLLPAPAGASIFFSSRASHVAVAQAPARPQVLLRHGVRTSSTSPGCSASMVPC